MLARSATRKTVEPDDRKIRGKNVPIVSHRIETRMRSVGLQRRHARVNWNACLLPLFLLGVVFTLGATATEPDLFLDLRRAVEARRIDIPEALRAQLAKQAETLTDCSTYGPIASHDARVRSPVIQYIFNAAYSWGYLRRPSGMCVVLFLPVEKSLSREEAADLLTASRIEFPVAIGPYLPIPPATGVPIRRGCDAMPIVDESTFPRTVTTSSCPPAN